MVDLDVIPQAARERMEQLGEADLVIGLLAPSSPPVLDSVLAHARESVDKLYTHVRTVVIHSSDQTPPGLHLETNTSNGLRTLPFPLFTLETSPDPARSIRAACDSVFAVAANLGARAATVIVSDLQSVTPQWMYRLIRPVLELDFDLVTPCYAHGKFEGLLNSAIVSPLTRALYGRRIQHPLGPDFAFSGRLIRHFLTASSPARGAGHARTLASLAVDAVCDGFEICQAQVGLRRYPPTDWMNQSSVLVQILGPLFNESEHHASFWQRIRGSQPVSTFGDPENAPADAEPLDIRRMIDSFHLGCRDLQEIWSAVLPPGTLLELSKLARLPPDHFQMPDRLWARIIYDFALGYRLRLLSPDHLLRAMTPLYLAWVASFVLEPAVADPAGLAQRLEDVGLAFEQTKPYALSRWRWPDRFNP